MSKFSLDKLGDGNILVGNGVKPWWHRDHMGTDMLFDGPVPINRVRDIFPVLARRKVAVIIPCDIDDPEMVSLDGDGNPFKLNIQEDRTAVNRRDNESTLGMFKAGYEIHQYSEWLLRNVETILNDELVILSAGILGNGEVAWVKVGLTENQTAGGLSYNTGLLAVTSANGTIATGFGRSDTLEVCDNTLSLGIAEAKENGTRVKVKHTKHSGYRIESARTALQVIAKAQDEFGMYLEALASVKVSDADLAAVIHDLEPLPEEEGRGMTVKATKHGQLYGLWNNSHMVAPVKGTALGIVQTFNTWEHHVKPTKKDTVRQNRNMEEAINGKMAAADDAVLASMIKLGIVEAGILVNA